MEHIDEDDDDECLDLGSKAWSRVINAAVKTGYREGIEEGSKTVIQSDFDTGYADGFPVAFVLGKYKAIASHLLKDIVHPPQIVELLEATRRGACHICKLEKDSNNLLDLNIIEKHKQHTNKILTTLWNYFEPILRNKNLNPEALGLRKN